MNSHDRSLSMILDRMLASYRAKREIGMDHAAAVADVLAQSTAGPKTKTAFHAAAAEASWLL